MHTRRYAALLLLFVMSVVVACGADAKQRTLKTTLVGLNAARDGFVAWDNEHQQHIVDTAQYLQEGQDKLKAYRAKRAKIEAGFVIAYEALATAALDLKAENLLAAITSVTQLYKALRALIGEDADGFVPAEVRSK